MAELPDAPWTAQPTLPDAPWATGSQNTTLPDAPWTTKPGVLDYGVEIGKAVAHGAVEAAITSPMRGYAGQHSQDALAEPERRRIALEKIMQGQDIDVAVQEAQTEAKPLPVTEHPLYQSAEAISGAMPKDKGILNPVVRDVASGFGSVGGNIGAMLIPGVNLLGIPNVVAQGAGEATERAVKAEATPEQIQRAARFGNVSGATEFADALLVNLGSWGKVAGLIKQFGVNVVKGAFIEGGQEGLQQFIQNVIAKGVYKPEQSLSEDVAYNAMIGAIVGGSVSGGMTRRTTPDSGLPTPEALNAAVAPPPTDPNMPAPGQAPVTATTEPGLPPGPPVVTPDSPYAGVRPGTPPTKDELPADYPILTPKEPILPPVPMPKEQVEFVQEQTEKFRPQTRPFDELLTPIPEGATIKNASLSDELVQTNPGINPEQVTNVLSQQLYGEMSSTVPVAVKELYQNAFDAIKGRLEKTGDKEPGNIDVKMDPVTRTVTVYDDGHGMPASVMGNEFLTIGGTVKETSRPSGGFGVAKVQILLNSEKLRVRSIRDGKYAELNTSGPELRASINKTGKAPNLVTRVPTAQDLKSFPKGRGTIVEVTLPSNYVDPGTDQVKDIPFQTSAGYHPVLQRSPLFENINSTFNGQPIQAGNQFPANNYTQLFNVKFGWGNARVYISKVPKQRYGANGHVLSNGLWQFSLELKRNPNNWASELIPFQVYVDLNSKVSAGQIGYPLAANRQGFSPATEKGFVQLFRTISLMYQRAGLEEMVSNFGTMQYLDYDPVTKKLIPATTKTIEPRSPPPKSAMNLMKPGDNVVVEEGKLIVNGREVPELTPQTLEEYKVTTDDLSVDQTEIDPNRVMIHDNTNILVSHLETRSVVDYGREKFGQRFDEFVYAIGDMFKMLRDTVAKGMPLPKGMTGNIFEQVPFGLSNTSGYETLTEGAVGISLDSKYHGVSITLPFTGIFVNPFLVTFGNEPAAAALSTVTTMIHEIAHHKAEYRTGHGHDVGWRHEMANIQIMLNLSNEFNFHQFQQRIVDIYTSYQDVFNHMNGVWTSGDFTLQPRGKRFEDFSVDQTSDGNVFGDATQSGDGSSRGSSMADWVVASETVPPAKQGRTGNVNTTGPSGTHRPSDNGRGANYAALRGVDPGISAPPQQPEVNKLRDTAKSALGGVLPPEVKEAAAHADRYSWRHKFLAGITQLLDSNPYFSPLRKYSERAREMHSDESKIHDAALSLLKNHWRKLGREQSTALENFIFDIETMPYLNETEKKLQVARQPTVSEFEALARKHKLGADAINVYTRMRQMDETFMTLLEQEAKASATRRIVDPVTLAARVDEIEAMGRAARAKPFFPFTRFGRYYLTVKDQAGKITHFETFEPRRVVGITTKRAEKYQLARKRELEKKVPPGHIVEHGVLPETAEPLIGLPTLLLQELVGEGVQFTSEQLEAIKLMQSSRNPAMALRNRAQYNAPTMTGVSRDLPRSFAKYYFHGGRYYAKVKHVWALRGHVAEAQLVPGNKAGLIASHMADHLDNTILDSRGDFGFWKGAIFLWAMGYSVAAATTNLTQTPMVSYPFLAGKFGDIRAAKHLVRSMVDVTNFYKRGSYTQSAPATPLAFEMEALGYGIKTGRVSETQSADIAGLAGGGKLISGMGGTKLEQAAVQFQEKAAWMFEMAEQFNRRVVYRAALRLAQENPTAKFVNESVSKYAGEFEQLLKGSSHQRPFSESEARAIISAIHATDQTQFVYSRHERSRLFRGPRNILFVFQQYVSSLLWMLGNNKSDVLWRWAIITMLMGGLGGIPGYEEFKDLFRMLAIRIFGKDVSVDKLIRDWTLQWFDGRIAPDIVLHGLARRGFGIPAIVDLLGEAPGRSFIKPGFEHSNNVPFPVLDRSRAIGINKILPFSPGKLFTPTDKLDKTMVDESQKASGAVFSVGFNMFKAIMDKDSPANDVKRWEKAMPRAMSSASAAYRAYSEGRERSSKGGPNSASTVINYDVRDTEQLMEVIARGLGYQPLRQQAKWDMILAQTEASMFYDMRKKGLMEEYYEALKGKDPKELDNVRQAIIKHNTELPTYAKPTAITADTLRRSMMGRERSVINREMGVPIQKSKIGISQEMQRLFPEATIDVRRVR